MEAMEVRCLLAAASPTAFDQYLLELVNRARANPAVEAARLGIDLNEGLAAGAISAAAKQPLAMNPYIIDAAQLHSQWMLDNDVFSHTGSGGSTPGDRMGSAGYVFSGSWSWGENIAWSGTSGTPNVADYVAQLHANLFIDTGIAGRGHRLNLLAPGFRAVGMGVKTGVFTSGADYNAVMATQDFAYSGSSYFLTGVAYTDAVTPDSFYTPGEGLGNISISARRTSDSAVFAVTTWGSGGYSLALPAGTYTLTASGAALGGTVTVSNVVMGAQNLKQDILPSMVAQNHAPTLTTIAALPGGVEDAPLAITYADLAAAANEADPDGDALSFRVESLAPGTLTRGGLPLTVGDLIAPSDTLLWQPPASANGAVPAFTVRAHDGSLASASAVAVTVQVAEVNDAPSLTAIANPGTINEDAGQQPVNLSGISAGGGESQTLQVTATSNNTSLIPNPTVSYTSPSATGRLTYTPVGNAFGTAVVMVTVRDAGLDGMLGNADDGTFQRQFTVTVNAVNDAPMLTTIAALPGGVEDAPLVITYADLAAAADEADPDGDALSFRVESLAAGALTRGGVPLATGDLIAPTDTLLWQPPANANGALPAFAVRAHDGSLASASAVAVTVQVAEVNDAPSFVKGPDQLVCPWAAAQVIDQWATAIVAGPANEAGQAVWFEVTAGRPEVFAQQPTISPEGTLRYAVNSQASGSSTVTVVLRDSGGTARGGADASPPATFTVTLDTANDAPSLTATSLHLPPIIVGQTNNGTLVHDLLAGVVSDADPGSPVGLAVIAADGGSGQWQYALDGSTWQDIGPASETQALLLAGDGLTRLRFLPDAGALGASGSIGFRAWDLSAGASGQVADASVFGGEAAFSAETATADAAVWRSQPIAPGKTVFTDAALQVVTLSLKGAGAGRLLFAADGPANPERIELWSTDARTTVTITPAGRNALTAIGGVRVQGALKSFTGKAADLLGDFTVTGPVGSLVLRDVRPPAGQAAGQTISVGPALGAKDSFTLTLGRAQDLSVLSQTPVKKIKAAAWLDTDSQSDLVRAPVLGTISISGDKRRLIAGDFQADIEATATTATSLAGLTVAGWLGRSGTAPMTEIRLAGGVGSVSVGAMRNTLLLVGVQPGVSAIPQNAQGFANSLAVLKSFTVRGLGTGDGFVNSSLVCWSIRSLTVRNVASDNSANGNAPLGVGAHEIKSYTRYVGKTPIRLSKLVGSRVVDEQADYSVRLV